jgi:hypothetical protein
VKPHQKQIAKPKNVECRMSKDGIAPGVRSQFGEAGSLTLFLN